MAAEPATALLMGQAIDEYLCSVHDGNANAVRLLLPLIANCCDVRRVGKRDYSETGLCGVE
jgi:hypothetical protein